MSCSAFSTLVNDYVSRVYGRLQRYSAKPQGQEDVVRRRVRKLQTRHDVVGMIARSRLRRLQQPHGGSSSGGRIRLLFK